MKRVFHILLFLLFLGRAGAEEAIRSIAEVRALSPERAAENLEVDIEVQILKFGLEKHGFFVHDEESGIYVSLTESEDRYQSYRQGHLLRIKGVTHQGNFLPHINAREIAILSIGDLPVPLKITDRQAFMEPNLDCRWIEFSGVVVDSIILGNVFSLRIDAFGVETNLVFPRTPAIEKEGPKLLNRAVRIHGVAASQWNEQRQMTGRIIQMNSLDDVTLIQDLETDPPLMEFNELLRTDKGSLEAVRTRGTVTYSEGKLIYLQASSGSLLVRASQAGDWRIGQKLEVVGTVVVEPFSPTLRAQEIRDLGQGDLPIAGEIRLGNPPFPASWHHRLVSVGATLLDSRQTVDALVLNCSADGQLFEARLANGTETVGDLAPGSVIQLQGICVLRSSQSRAHTFDPDGISLLLRFPDDIGVLSRPSWWTTGRVLAAVAIAGIITILALAWVGLLHRQVAEQTSVIRAQVAREATMKERQRLARELHDSIEQGMSGLALQLDTARRRSESGRIDDSCAAITLAGKMLAHCQRESRESIYDLRRSGEVEAGGTWHDELLLNEAESLGAEIIQRTEGRVRSLPATLRQQVSKVVREAAYNALRHGRSERITIIHQYGPDRLEVEVRDDGQGFDPRVPPPRGHFGLHGMRERAQRLGGTFELQSAPGEGTVVKLSVPYVDQSKPADLHDQGVAG
ncbi:MAG: sensor histidine kinase [Verrucomicrobiota bacterium]